ncbi:hypothetical protein BH18VER1_BH18VER1_11320 [soil metagenome]
MKNILSILTVAAFATVTPAAHAQSNTIRVGHFPNVTHVQALVGLDKIRACACAITACAISRRFSRAPLARWAPADCNKWTRVILPASLPFLVSGMKQGGAFAWRSLMAAEIYVTILTGFAWVICFTTVEN